MKKKIIILLSVMIILLSSGSIWRKEVMEVRYGCT